MWDNWSYQVWDIKLKTEVWVEFKDNVMQGGSLRSEKNGVEKRLEEIIAERDFHVWLKINWTQKKTLK